MDSAEIGASVYSEAKGEYTKQLCVFLVPEFHRFFMGCLRQAIEEEPNPKRQLWKFQERILQIPDWNVDRVQRETAKLISTIHCDYLDELITAVFIAHTKVLTAIRLGGRKSRVQIVVPKTDHFLFRALSECSRLLWSSAFLFHSELSAMEKQKNHRQIESLLAEGITQAIRGLLPVKNILKDCIADLDGGAEDTHEEEDEKDDKEDKEEKDVDTIPVLEPMQMQTPLESASAPVSTPAPSPAPEPISAPIITPSPVAIPEPIKETVQPPAHVEESAPILTPVASNPSVQFTNFDQVIHIDTSGQQKTQFEYVETKDGPSDETENAEATSTEIEFVGDGTESLSDVEDLEEESKPTSLDDNDFEELT